MTSLKSIIIEESFSGKVIMNVDIQPEYEGGIFFKPHEWCEWLNSIDNEAYKIIFLYNGEDTMGMVSEQDYKTWLLDNALDESVLDTSIFYDKGYAFFRYCMDNSIDEDSVANFVRFMYENNIRDSRDMDREMWAKYLRQYRRIDKKEVYTLLQAAADCVHIPDLMDFLKQYNNIVLTGGGINECLKEVEIALKALNKPYSVFKKFTY